MISYSSLLFKIFINQFTIDGSAISFILTLHRPFLCYQLIFIDFHLTEKHRGFGFLRSSLPNDPFKLPMLQQLVVHQSPSTKSFFFSKSTLKHIFFRQLVDYLFTSTLQQYPSYSKSEFSLSFLNLPFNFMFLHHGNMHHGIFLVI